ncbi:MAG: dTDP-4-dehydrorhamnose reductase [Planctomycetaceae bacterium]|nr:dTDP-4-dehydrorhamnose reductase [Planctomycetaceae bacterium]
MDLEIPRNQLEMWGGLECTRNRVKDQYFDQLVWSGHDRRLDDLDRIAGLGISVLRYPALWEQAASTCQSSYDWSWADSRLKRLKELKLRPIVGFLHHGSGPRGIDLLSPRLGSELEAYARAFAMRFPWVDFYTPINEPLTTARFSALYGFWYPHSRDNHSFAMALLNQCKAIALAMRAIRESNPDAKLVQTEDLGKTFSSPSLRYQADFENARRWLTFDLLSGRVDKHHPIGDFLLWCGIAESELDWFREHVCAPDLIGMNYYVTSERYLDRRVNAHHPACWGGNERHVYADVEAVRVRQEGLFGAKSILMEAWKRYHIPLVITEAHLACGREDQLRWLWDIWREATAAKDAGVDVRAVTAWSLFGAFDWHNLVTRPEGRYEAGAFNVSGPVPRPTALAGLVRELACGKPPTHPVLNQPGWWRRAGRLTHAYRRTVFQLQDERELPGPPILITGAGGSLARGFSRICEIRGLPCRLLSRMEMDIADLDSVRTAMDQIQPWAVINAAGYVRVDEAERDPQRCRRDNVEGPAILARECRRNKIPLLTFSSDLVFDGSKSTPYAESDPVNPLGVYGRAKAEAEQRVFDVYSEALIVRSGAFFSPWDNLNFVSASRLALHKRQPCFVVEGIVSPTYLPDLVHACLDLLIDHASGLWHLAGDGEVSWSELARELALRTGLPEQDFEVCVRRAPSLAMRPPYSALMSERGARLPHWRDALNRYFMEPLRSEA